MGFLSILWEYKSIAAIGLLFLALLSMYAYTGIIKKDRDAAVNLSNSLKGELSISQASVKSLQDNIKEQNAKIDKFQTDAADRLEKNKDNLDKATTSAGAINKQADALLKRAPLKDTTACTNANVLVNEEINNAIK